jgi:DNA-nicking Smr family endonuclease
MNHGGGGRPHKGGRQVTDDEAELWRQLTHSVDKVKTKPRVAGHGDTGAAASASSEAAPAPRRRAAPASSAQAAPSPPPVPRPPPTIDLDRRSLRQVATGKVPIDAVLDLHGLRQDTAHTRLRAFLVSSQAKGHRMVLVITGKGGGSGGRPFAPDVGAHRERRGEGSDPTSRGVLRRSVPCWLDGPEFRAIVLGYAAAGARHGGQGALYVRLRKLRDA